MSTDISYEIVCVNDCSKDETLTILYSFAEVYDNIVIINNQINKGVSYCRNRGLKSAQGKWVWFVDSDDLIVPGAADRLLDVGEHYNADMVVGKFKNIPEAYKLNKEEYGFGKEIDELGLNISQLPMSMDGDIGAGMCMCITQKSVFTNNELWFNERVGMLEDGLMHWELEQVDLMVARVKECVYLYRFSPCSASNKITDEKRKTYYESHVERINVFNHYIDEVKCRDLKKARRLMKWAAEDAINTLLRIKESAYVRTAFNELKSKLYYPIYEKPQCAGKTIRRTIDNIIYRKQLAFFAAHYFYKLIKR